MQKNKNAYEKTIWRDGETIISADLLNKVEDKLVDLDSQVASVEHENQRQNFYINALYNENIDGRLTAEEENSNDIKLESSKQGLVEVEKVVGNTLVNRVSEPMRELTLNGDIDEQGTFVTTAEGADNGLVDVMCEGNTLTTSYLNNQIFIKKGTQFSVKHAWIGQKISCRKGKLNDVIYYRVNITLNKLDVEHEFLGVGSYRNEGGYLQRVHSFKKSEIGKTLDISHIRNINDICFDMYNSICIGLNNPLPEGVTSGVEFCNFTINDYVVVNLTEVFGTGNEPTAEWCDKNIPYFEGMKSVGEQANGNHKIEIVSNNKNLWTCGDILGVGAQAIPLDKPLKAGTYTISSSTETKYENHPVIAFSADDTVVTSQYLNQNRYVTLTKDINKIHLYSNGYNYNASRDNPIDYTNIQIEKGTQATSYVPHASNKKEILLNEPLRGLPNGVKDKPVKIDGKWYIERNCAEVTLLEDILTTGIWGDDNNKRYVYVHNMLPGQKLGSYIYTDKIPYTNRYNNSDYFGISSSSVLVFCFPEEIETIEEKKELVRPYLQNGGLKVVYELAKPIYEPLEASPELVCYDEVTHISNNSIVPCNMKVKNTGFSCRALTSDGTYTVIHDGGEGVTSKVDTTDNMVRLSGKGKKVSDVMVLDGTVSKTYGSFEGMKSTFEDKLITQEMVVAGEELAENLGKYRVGVKVVGKNKIDFKNIKILNTTVSTYETINGGLRVKYNSINTSNSKIYTYIRSEFYEINPDVKRLILSYKHNSNKNQKPRILVKLFDSKTSSASIKDYNVTGFTNMAIPQNAKYYQVLIYSCNGEEGLVKGDYIDYVDVQLEEVLDSSINATQYEPYKEYNTSVYLNSPLLKGDEIVVRDGRFGVLRKRKSIVYKGNEDWKVYKIGDITSVFYFNFPSDGVAKPVLCDLFSFNQKAYDTQYAIEGITFDGGANRCYVQIHNSKLETKDEAGFKKWLQKNYCKVIYEILEPYFERITPTLPKLVSEIPNNAILNIDSTIPCQSVKVSYTGNLPSVYKLENDISIIEDHNIDIIATTFDIDYRLLEFGWMLEDAGIAGVDLLSTLNTAELKNRTLSRYEQAKIIIIGKAYDKETLTSQLTKYLEKEIITKTEYDELIALMEVNE